MTEPMTLTDDLVEKALEAYDDATMSGLSEVTAMRAALSAVLPDVIAAERERAAKVAEELPVETYETLGGWREDQPAETHACAIAAAIRKGD